VADQIKKGTFTADEAADLGDLELDASADAAAACRAWLEGRRAHLNHTTDQLFQWGTP
jgi:hypothetical protein